MSTFLTDLDAYFERIGHSYERAPTLEILQRLHALHTETIAFENLSPFLGQGVYLDARLLIAGTRGSQCCIPPVPAKRKNDLWPAASPVLTPE